MWCPPQNTWDDKARTGIPGVLGFFHHPSSEPTQWEEQLQGTQSKAHIQIAASRDFETKRFNILKWLRKHTCNLWPSWNQRWVIIQTVDYLVTEPLQKPINAVRKFLFLVWIWMLLSCAYRLCWEKLNKIHFLTQQKPFRLQASHARRIFSLKIKL